MPRGSPGPGKRANRVPPVPTPQVGIATPNRVTAPVIACPPYSDRFGGADLFSSLRMPSGIAPLVVLSPSGAALAAAKIFAVHDPDIRERIHALQVAGAERIVADDAALRSS